jgi:apolipoprotein N-acyltransferase
MSGYGGLGDFGGLAVLLLLTAYLALFPAIWALVCAPLTTKAPTMNAKIIVPALMAAIMWTGLDFWKNLLLTGFNWTPLAGGLAEIPLLIGPADLIGIYGLTLPIALISILLASIFTFRENPKATLIKLTLAILLLAAQVGYGVFSYNKYESEVNIAQTYQVNVLQPSVPQDQKWDPIFRRDILSRFDQLIGEAKKGDPWLIIWPETAAPFIYGLDQVETHWLDSVIAEANSAGHTMLVGLATFDYDSEGNFRLLNRSWLLGPKGSLGRYDKTHLVPFGEYIPLADILPFLKWPFMQGLLGAVGTYSPGHGPTKLVHDNIPFGVMICFESLFPYQGRDRALLGARFLTVTTNDAWFGLSDAPDQHLTHSVIRAVETRLPLVRAANNGISALISPSGRIVTKSPQNQIKTYSLALPILPESKLTLFVRGGYYLAPICGILTIALALVEWAKYFRQNRLQAAKNIKKRLKPKKGRPNQS